MNVTQGKSEARVRPRIGLTMGDPAGIGPEVTLKAAMDAGLLAVCRPVIIGDAQYLSHWARRFSLTRGYEVLNRGEPFPAEIDGPLIYNLNNVPGSIELGQAQAACGKA